MAKQKPELTLLTIPELTVILRLSESGVRKMIQRGELPAFKLGGRWFVREHALLHALEQLEAATTPLPELDEAALMAAAYNVPDIPPDPEPVPTLPPERPTPALPQSPDAIIDSPPE